MALRNLDDLAVFLQVVNHTSFSAAARHLQVAPKAVSKQIARLETALGVALFERNTRNLRITSEGHAIAERVRVALALLDEVEEIAKGDNHELSGMIRLTAPAPFGRKYVAAAIADFCLHHPEVRFDLRLSDQVLDLYSGNFDLALRMGALTDSRLVAKRVANNRRILVASTAYIERYGVPKTPEALAHHQCLIFAYPGVLHNRWVLHQGTHIKEITIQGNLSSDNGEVLHAWCLAGLGISLRETWDIHEALTAGTLQQVLAGWTGAPSQISIVRARRQPIPRHLSAFIEYLVLRWQKAPWDFPHY